METLDLILSSWQIGDVCFCLSSQRDNNNKKNYTQNLSFAKLADAFHYKHAN